MTKNKTYSEKLKDPRWQKKRLDILSRDKFTCKVCGDKETTLHIHHKTYERGKEPWEYPSSNLITLCEYCHFVVENMKIDGEEIEFEYLRGTKVKYLEGEFLIIVSYLNNSYIHSFDKVGGYIGNWQIDGPWIKGIIKVLSFADKNNNILNSL